MSFFLVLYIEAEKIAFGFSALWCKIAKKGVCSALVKSLNFLTKLMRAANSVRFCLNFFVVDKNDSDKTVHNFSLLTAFSDHQRWLVAEFAARIRS